eukprot:127294-Prorocentrum_minimum.AAC.1
MPRVQLGIPRVRSIARVVLSYGASRSGRGYSMWVWWLNTSRTLSKVYRTRDESVTPAAPSL